MIYTKKGDSGTTRLIGGEDVKKYALRLEAYGTIDELNSSIGVVLTAALPERVRSTLVRTQSLLFVVGAHLACGRNAEPDRYLCSDDDVRFLEQEIDAMDASLPPQKSFILPAGTQGATFAHLARTVCRRAERRIAELADTDYVNPVIMQYVNRLSDYLFVSARKINFDENGKEFVWNV